MNAPAFSPRGRLFWKFFAAFWLALLVASVVVGSFVWLDNESGRSPAVRVDQGPGPIGRLLVDAAAATAEHGGRKALEAWLADTARGERRGPSVFAVDANGRELLGREVPVRGVAAGRALPAAPDDEAAHLAMREVMLDGSPVLLFAPAPPMMRGPHGPPRHADGFAPRGLPLPPWFLPLATGLVASVLLAALLAWYFAKPIRALDAALKRAGAGDLGVRVEPEIHGRRDEIADLGREFDRMIQRIDGLLQSQRRLLHDVSHELRSPLARLQVCVGLARRDPPQAAAMLERIEKETVLMDALVEEILTLARLEAGAVIEQPTERIDLGDVLLEAIDDAKIEADARRVTLAMAGDGRLSVIAHASLVRRAIDNVLRNAIQYSPEGGTVDIGLAVDANDAVVTIADRGAGLTEEECRTVFEPFVRGRHRSGKGHGLGLAIVRRAVEAQHGAIAAAPRGGGGLCVTIRLPAAA